MSEAFDGTFESMCDALSDDRRKVMIDRQRKYGPGNIPEFGVFGTVVRMNDKFARLKNLVINGKGGEVADETLEDTLIDLANYADIARAQIAGWWTTERCPRLSEDVVKGAETEAASRPFDKGDRVRVLDCVSVPSRFVGATGTVVSSNRVVANVDVPGIGVATLAQLELEAA